MNICSVLNAEAEKKNDSLYTLILYIILKHESGEWGERRRKKEEIPIFYINENSI